MSMRPCSGFTLIEMMIAVALSTMIVYVAMAGFRVATQSTTIANRRSRFPETVESSILSF